MMDRRTRAGLLALVAGWALISASDGPPAKWRDLNHNGRLDVYEDNRQPVASRVADLVGQMTVEEKVGTLFHGTLPANGSAIGASATGYEMASVTRLINEARLTSFITRLNMPLAELAEQNNAVQRIAEQSRLGIPVTISTDPRHHFAEVAGASSRANGFSLWPEPLGFAAIGDAALVRRFGQIAAQDYRAVGIHMALSPMADVASEPRWPRISGTFGADPKLVSVLAGAYVEGFQGSPTGLKPGGVATVVKHWVGYGASPEGFDGHNIYGNTVRMSQSQFARHVSAFGGAFKAGSAAVMPTYPIVKVGNGPNVSTVGAGFDKDLLGNVLRRQQRFSGMVISDWGIANDCVKECREPTKESPQLPQHIATPWGTESLTREARMALAINAGVDQIGGENRPEPLLAAVRSGAVSMARLDAAVATVMKMKFELGLFDNPYVDPTKAGAQAGTTEDHLQADAAQRAAHVLLQNRDSILPVKAGTKVWLSGVSVDAAKSAGFTVVDAPAEADVALVRASTPFETLHPWYFFGARQHEGRLDFRAGDKAFDMIAALPPKLPVVLAVDMDRPAILTALQARSAAMLAIFGASDAALLDVVAGRAAPKGRLPFNLPRSMAAVEKQDPATPDDDVNPLFRRGFGLRYSN